MHRRASDTTPDAPAVPAFLEHPHPRRQGPSWLAVHHLWEDLLLETRHFAPGHGVQVGERLGWRWRVLGAELGEVRGVTRRLAPWLLPGWSEVRCEALDDFAVPEDALGEASHQLFEVHEDGWAARVAAGWPVVVEHGGRSWDLEALLESGAATRQGPWVRIPVRPGQRMVVRLGEQTFAAWTTPRPDLLERERSGPDPLVAGLTGVLAAAALAFAAVVVSTPGSSTQVLEEVPDHLVEMMRAPEPPPLLPSPEGGAGTPTATHPEPRGTADADPVEEPSSDAEVVAEAGLLGGFADGDFDELLGDGTLAAGLVASANGLIGTKGRGGPGGGLGTRGGGLGDGRGTGEASGLASGGWGIGCGSDDPDGCAGSLGNAKGQGSLGFLTEDPIVVGALDRATIDGVVRSHLSALRYCYQRRLQQRPDLAGKVVMRFTIAADGTVSSSVPTRSTLGDPEVEQCLKGRFLRMRFPAPRGGGVVAVSYPFVFSA